MSLNFFKTHLKKTLFFFCFVCVQNAFAVDSPFASASGQSGDNSSAIVMLLNDIKAITLQILTSISSTSAYISQIVENQAPEDWATLQTNFQAIGTYKGADGASTEALINDFLKAVNRGDLPSNADSLSFTRSLTKASEADKYIGNTAGLNVLMDLPSNNIKQDPERKKSYDHLINTITSIQTFNAFLLKNFYANLNNRRPSIDLMKDTSDPTWIAKVTSESIGTVLRQMLLYISQSYVLLNRIADNQQYALAAQAMTNTLLVTLNQGSAKMANSMPNMNN